MVGENTQNHHPLGNNSHRKKNWLPLVQAITPYPMDWSSKPPEESSQWVGVKEEGNGYTIIRLAQAIYLIIDNEYGKRKVMCGVQIWTLALGKKQ